MTLYHTATALTTYSYAGKKLHLQTLPPKVSTKDTRPEDLKITNLSYALENKLHSVTKKETHNFK